MRNNKEPKAVYIVDGARTPFIKARQGPGPFSAADLGFVAGRAVVDRMPFSPEVFEQVIVGCVSPSEEEANIARIIALRLGLGNKVPAFTVQRNCASGLQAIDSAAQSIASGRYDLVLAGGTEAMSRAPLLFNRRMASWLGKMQSAKTAGQKFKTVTEFRLNFLVPIIGLLKGLTDPIVNLSMGQTAEELAYRFGITRKEMDEYAMQSHQRVMAAQSEGLFEEITPLYAMNGTVYEQDDGVRSDISFEKLEKLKPVFDKYGNITAGNSSQISDGAAFVVLASIDAVEKYDLPVIAKIVDIEWAALDPSQMGLGPIYAMTPLLMRNNLTLNDVKHMEINEAFAAQVLACIKAWQDPEFCKKQLDLSSPLGEMDMARLNPEGGAIAIGHPVGASGARLVLHSAKMMQKNNLDNAVVSLCIGGGQGGAILLERSGV